MNSTFSCTDFITLSSYKVDGFPVVQVAICVIGVPLCLSTTVANLLVLVAVWRTPSLHSPSHILLVGLAASDLGVGLAVLPTTILSHVAKITEAASLFCKARQAEWAFGIFLGTVSLLTVSAINVDRYMAIHYHLRYPQMMTTKRVLAVLTCIWLFGCSGSFLYSIQIPSSFMTSTNTVVLVLSLAIIIFVSCSIRRVVRRHQRQIASQMQAPIEHGGPGISLNLLRFKKSFQSTQILCWILVLSYIPLAVMEGVISSTDHTTSNQTLLELATLLVCSKSLFNPFLYCWRYQPIRIALLSMLPSSFPRNSVRRIRRPDVRMNNGIRKY